MGVTLLHRARRQAGYRSSDDLADAAGVDRRLWRECERGQAGVPDQALPRVAEALGVSELEVLIMSADAQLDGRAANEVETDAPDTATLELLLDGSWRDAGDGRPMLLLFPDEGGWTAIDASDMSETFVESFSTREAAAAWLLMPGLEVGAIRGWEAGRATRPASAAQPAGNLPRRHVALEIDAVWAGAVARELGIELTADEAEQMAEYAADNLWGSDLIAALGPDQLVAEIENYDEQRASERGSRGAMPRAADDMVADARGDTGQRPDVPEEAEAR